MNCGLKNVTMDALIKNEIKFIIKMKKLNIKLDAFVDSSF